jgi:CDP-diacylglycerol--glycerol-3-phosphate 3-phosphatidyltransferase
MNLPNRLTLARLGLTVLFVIALSVDFPYHYTLALVFFVLAAATDYLDGEIARRFALITSFGKLMDPLADKIMTAAAFVCLVPLRAIPAWAAIIVIVREFLITGLRLLAVSKGRILAADPIGKHKTFWQIATVLYFLGLLAYNEIAGLPTAPGSNHGARWGTLWVYGGWAVSSIAVALTLYSGIDYLWRHRAMLEVD